jgi:hypothetical protein
MHQVSTYVLCTLCADRHTQNLIYGRTTLHKYFLILFCFPLNRDSLLQGGQQVPYSEITAYLKNVVFWDVVPCRSSVNRRFGGTYRPHLQGRKISERGTSVSRWLQTAEDGDDTFLRNVGLHKIYMAPHPRKRHSS